eukprot:TRINITY_DN15069_c0_g1_i1.p1 TRINITY_DN15069_c0_g1~~TRINITY_DN15069_c0_g1_i1.p1  ORF type:complete len:366 (+),score=149.07 TRINITY_DN15069_c0_g1_i1:49-1146(+)
MLSRLSVVRTSSCRLAPVLTHIVRLNATPALSQKTFGFSARSSARSFSTTQEQAPLNEAAKDDFVVIETPESTETPKEEPAPVQNDPRLLILEASLKHVNKLGWTRECLAAGAKDAGLDGVAEGMFKEGAVDLVRHFIHSQNDRFMYEVIPARLPQFLEQPVRKRLAEAVKLRLELNAEYMPVLPQALGIMALPPNVPLAVQELAGIVNDIWFVVGDRSTDINWYTKRAMLAGLYSATELYMLTDKSVGFVNTWNFLDNRIEDVMSVSQFNSKIQQNAASSIEILTNVVQNVIPPQLSSLFKECAPFPFPFPFGAQPNRPPFTTPQPSPPPPPVVQTAQSTVTEIPIETPSVVPVPEITPTAAPA